MGAVRACREHRRVQRIVTPSRLWPWIALAAAAGVAVYWAPPADEDVVVVPTARKTADGAAAAAAGRAAAAPPAADVLEIRPRSAPADAAARLWSSAASQPASAPPSPLLRPVHAAAEAVTPTLPPPPQAPPLPFRLLGRYNDEDRNEVILLHEGQVAVVHAGDLVGDTYRVETIAGNVMVLTYLPLNLQQTMDIGVAQ